MPSIGNVELIDRLFTLSNRSAIGDASALSELISSYHDDADVRAALDGVSGDTNTAELIRRYFESVNRKCYVWFIYADDVQDHGERVVALGGIRTVDKGTRDDREQAVGWVFEIRDGRIDAVRAYASHAEAMDAVRNSA